MKLNIHKYLPAKNNNNKRDWCKHSLNVVWWGFGGAANVAGCRYRRRVCWLATFPGKLSRNFQTDGEESNLQRSPFLKAAQIICGCVGFHRAAADRGGGTFLNCKSCFEWLKPDSRLVPPRVTVGSDSLSHALLLISQLLLWLSSWAPEVGGLFDMWSPGFLPGGSSTAVVTGGERLFRSPASAGCCGSRGLHFLLASSWDFVFAACGCFSLCCCVLVLWATTLWRNSTPTAPPSHPKKAHLICILDGM